MPRATTGLAYLTLALVVLGAFFFSIFVTSPQWADYRLAQADLEKARHKQTERTAFLASIDARKRELEGYGKDAIALSILFPDQHRPANTLAVLQGLSNGSGALVVDASEPKEITVSDTGVPTTPSEDQSRLVTYETTVSVRGTYAQVRAFLRDLEQSLLFTDVKALELQAAAAAADGTGVPDRLDGKLTLYTYIQQVPR